MLVEKILNDLDSSDLQGSITKVSLLFTNDKEIKKLNCTYRQKDKPTDVLSFSHIEGVKVQSWDESLGELVISLDTAKRQAKEFGVSMNEEIVRLIIHGLLHLIGYDHENVSHTEAQRMRRMEKKILTSFETIPILVGSTR